MTEETDGGLSPLGRALPALRDKHRVPGVQLAVYHRGELATFEAGELEHGTGRAITPDSAVPIGSVTKSFTATVAMILVADGDLELDAPVAEYLTGLDLAGVTLRHLLSHTSGLVSDPETEPPAASLPRFLAEHCRAADLMLPPGTGFSYSNLGYVLIGRLIETITGMDWWEATESILLRPLGVSTRYVCAPGPRRAQHGVAAGHSANASTRRVRPVRQSLPLALAPAGALAVSARDLATLGLMHVGKGNPELLPQEYAEQMRRPDPAAEPFGLADGWSLGFAIFNDGGTGWVGHDGNADGSSCHLRVDPVGGSVVALTSNSNSGHGLWQDLRAELAAVGISLGSAWAPPPRRTGPPPGCAGRYGNGNVQIAVTAGREGVFLSVDADRPARLTCYDGLTFAVRDGGSSQPVLSGRFVTDADTGVVAAVQLAGRLACRLEDPQSDRRMRIA